jgi:hypothetical protein
MTASLSSANEVILEDNSGKVSLLAKHQVSQIDYGSLWQLEGWESSE